MKPTLQVVEGKPFLECPAGDVLISSEREILELLSLGYGHDTHRFLFREDNFPARLYDLKTGLAGAVFQKLAVYRVRAAVVMGSLEAKNPRFTEFMSECNKGNQLRFFTDREAAVAWLIAD